MFFQSSVRAHVYALAFLSTSTRWSSGFTQGVLCNLFTWLRLQLTTFNLSSAKFSIRRQDMFQKKNTSAGWCDTNATNGAMMAQQQAMNDDDSWGLLGWLCYLSYVSACCMDGPLHKSHVYHRHPMRCHSSYEVLRALSDTFDSLSCLGRLWNHSDS